MIKRYSTYHFDVRDVVAMEIQPVVGLCYWVHLRPMGVVILKGKAAEECLKDFLKRDDYHWSKGPEFKENDGHL